MWAYVVVVDALAIQYRAIRALHASHHLVPFLECAVIALHPVIVQATLQPDPRNMNRVRGLSSCGWPIRAPSTEVTRTDRPLFGGLSKSKCTQTA